MNSEGTIAVTIGLCLQQHKLSGGLTAAGAELGDLSCMLDLHNLQL